MLIDDHFVAADSHVLRQIRRLSNHLRECPTPTLASTVLRLINAYQRLGGTRPMGPYLDLVAKGYLG